MDATTSPQSSPNRAKRRPFGLFRTRTSSSDALPVVPALSRQKSAAAELTSSPVPTLGLHSEPAKPPAHHFHSLRRCTVSGPTPPLSSEDECPPRLRRASMRVAKMGRFTTSFESSELFSALDAERIAAQREEWGVLRLNRMTTTTTATTPSTTTTTDTLTSSSSMSCSSASSSTSSSPTISPSTSSASIQTKRGRSKSTPRNVQKPLRRSNSWSSRQKSASAPSLERVGDSDNENECVSDSESEGTNSCGSSMEIRLELPAKAQKEVLSVSDDMPEGDRKRALVINEIINTERDYVHDLQTLVSVYKNPMREEKIFTSDELGVIFSNVHLLIEVNKMLLSDMVQRVKKTNGAELGDSFLLFGDYLKMYATYCSNFDVAAELVASERVSSRLRPFLARVVTSNRLGLRDYLIKPVQRICKYPLLLRELIKCTEMDHPDFVKLTNALSKIQSVVASVNQRKELEDGVEAVAQVIRQLSSLEKFGVQLMVPGRQFVQEGMLLAAPKDQTEFRPLHYFLFGDMVVITECQPKGGKGNKPAKYEVEAVLPLGEASVNLKMKGLEDLSIEIETRDTSYVLPFRNAQQKRKFVQSRLLAAGRSACPHQRKQSG